MAFVNSTLFPVTTDVSDDRLTLGGCAADDLASEFGTPLYVFDEATLRQVCREFVGEFGDRYADSRVLYASKAFINPALARLVSQEGLGLDVVSGGELAVAQAAGVPAEDIYFHGNNKGAEELEMALDYGVGRIVVDNFSELELLDGIARSRGAVQEVMLRLSPGVDPHTHVHTTTGTLDSKFGFAIETGDGEQAMRQAMDADALDLVGVHMHLGSPIFELEPYAIGIDAVLTFVADLNLDGFELREFSPGGGFAIGYLRDRLPPTIGYYAEVIASAVKQRCSDLGLGSPRLVVEPGRAIVGRAGVALYSVGSIKDIPGIRKYVSLDGGMGDNIRPALYEAEYEAVVANRMSDPPSESVLIRDISLPVLERGDLIAIPASGAYAPSMASNYNLNPRPAVVVVNDGEARLIRRRETYQDMMLCDVVD
jgi:diaminopimelate decarboxylase